MRFVIFIFYFIAILLSAEENNFIEKKVLTNEKIIQEEIFADFNHDNILDKLQFMQQNGDYTQPNYINIYLSTTHRGKYRKITKKLKNFPLPYYSGYGINVTHDNKIYLTLSKPNERGVDFEKYYFIFEYKNNAFLLSESEYTKFPTDCESSTIELFRISAHFLRQATLNSFDPISIYERLEKSKHNSNIFVKIGPKNIDME